MQSLALQGRLDLRCRFATPWAADHDALPAGQAPYHVVLAGQCRVELPAAGASLELEAGDVLLLPHGAQHRLCDGAAPPVGLAGTPRELHTRALGALPLKANLAEGEAAEVDILCGSFAFDPHRRGLLLEALPEHIVVRTRERPEFTDLRALLRLMVIESEHDRPGGQAILTQLSGALFGMLLRAYLDTQALPPGALALLRDPRLRPALQAMLDDPRHDWSVAELARRVHMSRPNFARVFAAVSGSTPVLMLTRVRMERAAALLRRAEPSVAAVAELTGYESEAAFSRAFTRHHGMPPGAFRRTAATAPPAPAA